MTTLLHQPDIKPLFQQIARQPFPLIGQPETAIGKAAMQQNQWLAAMSATGAQAKMRNRDLDAAVRIAVVFYQINVFGEIAQNIRSEQAHRK